MAGDVGLGRLGYLLWGFCDRCGGNDHLVAVGENGGDDDEGEHSVSEDGNRHSAYRVEWTKAPHRVRPTKPENVLLFCDEHKSGGGRVEGVNVFQRHVCHWFWVKWGGQTDGKTDSLLQFGVGTGPLVFVVIFSKMFLRKSNPKITLVLIW